MSNESLKSLRISVSFVRQYSGKLDITDRGFSKFLKLAFTIKSQVLTETSLNSQFHSKSGSENPEYDVIEILPAKIGCGKMSELEVREILGKQALVKESQCQFIIFLSKGILRVVCERNNYIKTAEPGKCKTLLQ